MVVLSYDSAVRSLLMMALYLIAASLLFKGVGLVMEMSFTNSVDSLLSGNGLSFSLPDFNFDSFSFDLILNVVKEKISEFIHVLLPSTLAAAYGNYFVNTTLANKVVYIGSSKLI